jgi:hypothetical protein
MRTRDWRTFYDAAGRVLGLPLTPEAMLTTTLIDPARSGGLFWMNVALDSASRPIVAYMRNFGGFGPGPPEGGGYSSVPEAYLARFNGSAWDTRQLTSWGRAYPLNAYPTTFVSLTGPHPDSSNIARWYTRVLLPDGDAGDLDTSWLRLDPTTLATTPATPSLPSTCASGNDVTWAQFRPAEFPAYRDPKTDKPFTVLVHRSAPRTTSGAPEPYDPQRDDSHHYYYIRWEAIDRGSQEVDPALPGDPEPPRTMLTLHRTSCVK